jgi:hypothetical protein
MTSADDVGRTILRNKLLGRWAAEKLGVRGCDAEAYSDVLARATVDPERNDVFSKIRKDFDAAGVVQSDEQILHEVMKVAPGSGSERPSACRRRLKQNPRAMPDDIRSPIKRHLVLHRIDPEQGMRRFYSLMIGWSAMGLYNTTNTR